MRAFLLCIVAVASAAQTLVADGHTGSLLGGWHEGKWIDSAAAAKLAREGARYLVSDGSEPRMAGAARPIEGPCGDSWEIPNLNLAREAIAITAGAFVAPKVIPSDARAYQIAFRAVLDRNSIRSPVKIDQLWQADIDGDGAPEVLASLYLAAKPGGTINQPGDYSMIAVRFSDARKKVTTVVPLIERYTRGGGDITRLRLGPLVDINGDGKLELIVRGEYVKGKFTHVYEYRGGKFERALECTCGG